MRPERLIAKSRDVVQLVGLYFQTHVAARLGTVCDQPDAGDVLTQRERQCLAWASRGKTVADTAVLVGIAPRTVVFHLENARPKLEATSTAQCVAEAVRRRLLP
ncbi:helix-turn-helix domain-containing protein [Bradyrhizobium sp. AZCC 2262]|uniref:helix-turn-helix domain-containing protein n=1 Tax=Bradyrhizobium sp. AZCC 2262 TaxID=3117022 RepID=UPI003FA609BD